MTPERFATDIRRMDADVEAWRFDPSDQIDPLSPQSAEVLARMAQPNDPYLLAFTVNSDIDAHGVSVRLDARALQARWCAHARSRRRFAL